MTNLLKTIFSKNNIFFGFMVGIQLQHQNIPRYMKTFIFISI